MKIKRVTRKSKYRSKEIHVHLLVLVLLLRLLFDHFLLPFLQIGENLPSVVFLLIAVHIAQMRRETFCDDRLADEADARAGVILVVRVHLDGGDF